MRHDREYWSRHVEEWRSGGLTQRAYCERHGLVYGTMNYWTRKLKPRGAGGEDQRLVELRAASEETQSGSKHGAAIELVVAGRYLLRLWPSNQPEHLREVIAVLESQR